MESWKTKRCIEWSNDEVRAVMKSVDQGYPMSERLKKTREICEALDKQSERAPNAIAREAIYAKAASMIVDLIAHSGDYPSHPCRVMTAEQFAGTIAGSVNAVLGAIDEIENY